jgi:hypothetical protein
MFYLSEDLKLVAIVQTLEFGGMDMEMVIHFGRCLREVMLSGTSSDPITVISFTLSASC